MESKNVPTKNKRFKVTKLLIFSMALTLVLCTIVGGTVAWLITNTDPVVNTFTYGDINITLEEDDTNIDGDNDPNTNKYPMVPGKAIEKNPKVTVKANSEDSWLFVKLEKSDNFDDFMTYEVANGWTALDGVEGVYYMEVSKTDSDAEYYVIKDNTVNVKADVTKEMLNALDSDGSARSYPTLTVTAYAVQRDADIEDINTAADAWALVNTTTP